MIPFGEAQFSLKAERKLLAEERLKLEDRISDLRQKAPSAQNEILDESFDEIFQMAMDLKLKSLEKLEDFKERIGLVNEERKWVDSTPETAAWKDLQSRMKSDQADEESPSLTAEAVTAYIAARKEAAEIDDFERDAVIRETVIRDIRSQIIDETIGIFSRNVAKYTLNILIAARKEVENALCFAITDRKETVNNSDQSGNFTYLAFS